MRNVPPKIVWQGFGIDDNGKEQKGYPIRIIEKAPNDFVIELSHMDAMGELSWNTVDTSNNWVLRALVKHVAETGKLQSKTLTIG